MSYTPTTDFPALLRKTANGMRLLETPGLDFIIATMARANMFLLWVSQTAPTSNLTTTVWIKPAVGASYAQESAVYLYNATDVQYELATPALWVAMLLAGTNVDPASLPVSVRTFGALGNSTTGLDGNDDTAAFQAAINTGRHVFIPRTAAGFGYRITAPLTISTSEQQIFGDGKYSSVLMVGIVFAQGVIVCATGTNLGPVISDLGIAFNQPDTTVRANLTAYPAAIDARNSPRTVVRNVSILRAMVGVDLTGGSSDSVVTGAEISAFTTSIAVDGSLDTVRIHDVEVANWGCTANQFSILQQTATIGISIGRADDFKISNCLLLVGTGLSMFAGSLGSGFGEVTETGFDTYGGIVCVAGSLSVSGCYFSIGNSAYQAIIQTGGNITMSGCTLLAASAGASRAYGLVDISNGASFAWSGGQVQLGTMDLPAVKVSGAGTYAAVSGLIFSPTANFAYSTPRLWKNSGRVAFTGNLCTALGTGSGNFIQIDTDDWDSVTGNAAPDSSWQFPTNPAKGTYSANNNAPQDTIKALRLRGLPTRGVLKADVNGAITTVFPQNGQVIVGQAANDPYLAGIGALQVEITGVNFNAANTDNAINVASLLPAGTTKYAIQSLRIFNASASLTTATFGLFSGAGGTGTALITSTACTVASNAANTANNMQAPAFNGVANTTAWFNFGTLQFRTLVAQGSAATADLSLVIVPFNE